jgi:hypothetical protein
VEKKFEKGQGPCRAVEPVMMMIMMMCDNRGNILMACRFIEISTYDL